jgi:hypothetical protein
MEDEKECTRSLKGIQGHLKKGVTIQFVIAGVLRALVSQPP